MSEHCFGQLIRDHGDGSKVARPCSTDPRWTLYHADGSGAAPVCSQHLVQVLRVMGADGKLPVTVTGIEKGE